MRLREVMARVLFSYRTWGELGGVPHSTIRAYAAGQRMPEREKVAALLEGLSRHREALDEAEKFLRSLTCNGSDDA